MLWLYLADMSMVVIEVLVVVRYGCCISDSSSGEGSMLSAAAAARLAAEYDNMRKERNRVLAQVTHPLPHCLFIYSLMHSLTAARPGDCGDRAQSDWFGDGSAYSLATPTAYNLQPT